MLNEPIRILFVCEMNQQRSPSFEEYFDRRMTPKYSAKSCGTQFGSEVEIDEDLLDWAEVVYCMDLKQDRDIFRSYPEYYHKVKTIGISDEYPRGSGQLIAIIQYFILKEKL